jgi:phosphonate transport system substrate-binding protein
MGRLRTWRSAIEVRMKAMKRGVVQYAARAFHEMRAFAPGHWTSLHRLIGLAARRFKSVIACALLAWGALGHAQSVLRVTAIPDESPTELARKFAPLGKYLEGKLAMKVEWTPVTDYAAAVETLVNKKVDLAWFGGFTFVQSWVRSGGKTLPLVQREEDTAFRSVFITRKGSGITRLEDLKGKTMSFGSQSSTSGHLMPRSYMLAAGVDPDVALKRVSFSGAHDATIAAVASGKVDAGALNLSVWNKFVEDKKVDTDEVKVFFTTPPYYDYNWTVHGDMPEALRDKIAHAFLDLNPSTPDGAEILKLQRATRFVPAQVKNFNGIKAAAENAGLLK